jgi:thiosulfate dehydrogenase
MSLKLFSAVFLAVCCAIAAGTLATYRPAAVATAAAPTADDLVGYGKKLVAQTFAEIGPDTDKPFAGNRLACQNCHLDAGSKHAGIPLIGVARAYPKFSARSGRVISLTERIDECMTRSMNGKPLPEGSREMAAVLAYIGSLDGPPAVQAAPAPEPPAPADADRGAGVYARTCALCHQPHGLGLRAGMGYRFPPLWGPDSFNDGAGMDRFDRAVVFIQQNMPRGIDPAHPQLDLQEAWDVAAFLKARPRPHYAGR